jgi:hypothetical protein
VAWERVKHEFLVTARDNYFVVVDFELSWANSYELISLGLLSAALALLDAGVKDVNGALSAIDLLAKPTYPWLYSQTHAKVANVIAQHFLKPVFVGLLLKLGEHVKRDFALKLVDFVE